MSDMNDEKFLKFIRAWQLEGVKTLDELAGWVRKYGVDWEWYDAKQ